MWSDWFAATFGSWQNVNSGFIGNALGSAVGVLGAYWVASRQMRSDRTAQRLMTGATAAAEILEKLYEVGRELDYIRNLDGSDLDPDEGISQARRRGWLAATEAFLVAGTLRAHLLPKAINAELTNLTESLRGVLVWEYEDEEYLRSVLPADTEILDTVDANVQSTGKELTDYIRAAVGDHR